MGHFRLLNQGGVRPSKVDSSSGCESRPGKVGQPPGSNHRAGGGEDSVLLHCDITLHPLGQPQMLSTMRARQQAVSNS
jgi:hypothetical protein